MSYTDNLLLHGKPPCKHAIVIIQHSVPLMHIDLYAQERNGGRQEDYANVEIIILPILSPANERVGKDCPQDD